MRSRFEADLCPESLDFFECFISEGCIPFGDAKSGQLDIFLNGLVDAFRSLPKHYFRCGGKTVLERVSRALGYESGELAADSRVGSMIGVKGY